jgi:hypothetical protein
MSDDNMIPSDVWDELDAWDKSQESDRRREYELKSRIESGDVEEPGIGDYDAYPQSDEADAELSALSTKSSDDDCNWVTMRGTPVCIGDDNEIEIGPDGIDSPEKDEISQEPDMFHNIKTDPTKGDVAELIQYAKDVATFKIRKDSLLSRAIKELTTDPTNEDRGRLLQFAGEMLTLKPAVEFVTGKNRKENPVNEDLAIIKDGVKKVVNGTVGNMYRLVKRWYKASKGTGEALPPGLLNRVNSRPNFVRSFSDSQPEATDDDKQMIDALTDEVMQRAGKDPSVAKVQESILDVMESLLAGKFESKKDNATDKAMPFEGLN